MTRKHSLGPWHNASGSSLAPPCPLQTLASSEGPPSEGDRLLLCMKGLLDCHMAAHYCQRVLKFTFSRKPSLSSLIQTAPLSSLLASALSAPRHGLTRTTTCSPSAFHNGMSAH